MTAAAATPDPVEELLTDLARYPGLVIAFSAGVDSALLLAAAMRALPSERVIAATAVSASLPAAELAYARDFAASVGARHVEVATDEMNREGYRENSTSRCYFCKAELLEVVSGLLDELPDGARVATGTNADDLVAGFRPGIRAASERGAITPLAGLTKEQIRATAASWGLRVWDKPQAACLSSRVAYGIQITPARLRRVELAEIGVRTVVEPLGARNVRVRDLGDSARVEVDAAVLHLPGWRDHVLAAVRDAGFEQVEIDPRGFRSGSMNEGQPAPA